MKLRSAPLYALAAILLMSLVGCRAKRKGVRAESEAATLKLLVTGGDFLGEDEAKKSSWVYVLSSCVPDTDGKYAGGDTVEFRSSGIKNGLSGCQVRVKTLSSTAGETLDMPFEDRVLYWKKELTVTQEVDGTFVIKSDLARTYQPRLAPGVSTFKLVVDVKLPEGESGDGLRARLTCDPKIFEFGEFKTSWFTFHVRFLPEQTSYACSHIDVFKGDFEHVYSAALGAAGKFEATAGGEIKTSVVELKKVENPGSGKPDDPKEPGKDDDKTPPGDGGDDGVIVETTEGECGEGEVFDVGSRTCRAAQ